MNTELDLLRRWLAEPGGGMISRPLARAAFGEILQEIDRLAGLRTDAEIQDGMSGDDAASELGAVIEWARRHSAVRPYIFEQPKDDGPQLSEAEKVHNFQANAERFARQLRQDLLGRSFDYADVTRDQAKPQGPNCRACNGTGEVIEYPADEDERIVACSACGGTGEATAI